MQRRPGRGAPGIARRVALSAPTCLRTSLDIEAPRIARRSGNAASRRRRANDLTLASACTPPSVVACTPPLADASKYHWVQAGMVASVAVRAVRRHRRSILPCEGCAPCTGENCVSRSRRGQVPPRACAVCAVPAGGRAGRRARAGADIDLLLWPPVLFRVASGACRDASAASFQAFKSATLRPAHHRTRPTCERQRRRTRSGLRVLAVRARVLRDACAAPRLPESHATRSASLLRVAPLRARRPSR